MKYTLILAAVQAVQLEKYFALPDYVDPKPVPYEKGDIDWNKTPYLEDGWITVPAQTDKVSDPHWGKDVQRVGHADWLDGHVAEVKKI